MAQKSYQRSLHNLENKIGDKNVSFIKAKESQRLTEQSEFVILDTEQEDSIESKICEREINN